MNRDKTYPKWKVKKGDIVKVLIGRDRGKTGKILQIDRALGRVTVERIHRVKKHSKPTAANPTGGIIEKEATIHISNVAKVGGKS